MNGYHCFNFTEKLSYAETLSKQKMSNFHFHLSLKLSQEEVHDFSKEVQKFPGEDRRGSAQLPTKLGDDATIETSNFCLYFSGSCMSNNQSL
jgi:hypothetical protein